MKKIAISAALAAILSAPAMAQNVEIYGIISTGFQQYDTGSTTLTRAADNAEASSRLGFKGSEDLGNGFKASFQLEGSLSPSTGTLGTSTTNQVFNREAWVGISGGFGEIRMGRQDVTSATDIEIASSRVGNFGLLPANGTAIELGSDQNNVIRYISPKLGGAQFELAHANGNGNGVTTDAQADQMGAFVRYDVGQLTVRAGYGTLDGATKAAQRDYTSVGANYNFGAFEIGGTHVKGDVSTSGDVTSKSSIVSTRVPLNNGLAVIGAYAWTEDGAQASNNKGTGYTVGLTKDLSKRTRLYGAYSAVDNESNATMNMYSMTTASAGADTSAFTVGVTHKF